MGDNMGTIVKLSDLVTDPSLGKRMDRWYEEASITVYKKDDTLTLVDTKGKSQGEYTLDSLIEEFEFESANSHVAKRCSEDI
ncbi:MAG: hypothetical protein PHS82_01145 [Lachnospiraceae bacterium]|nr:hypothetical protein [Lachnospiraceae bacterium]